MPSAFDNLLAQQVPATLQARAKLQPRDLPSAAGTRGPSFPVKAEVAPSPPAPSAQAPTGGITFDSYQEPSPTGGSTKPGGMTFDEYQPTEPVSHLDVAMYGKAGDSPLRPVDEQHPELSNSSRMGMMSLAATPETMQRELQSQGWETYPMGGFNFAIRRGRDDPWRVVDESSFTMMDFADAAGDVVNVAGDIAGGVVGGTLGFAAGGPVGAFGGTVAGSGAGGAAAEVLKQGVAKLAGYEPTLGEVGQRVATEGILGSTFELGAGLGGGVIRSALGKPFLSAYGARAAGKEALEGATRAGAQVRPIDMAKRATDTLTPAEAASIGLSREQAAEIGVRIADDAAPPPSAIAADPAVGSPGAVLPSGRAVGGPHNVPGAPVARAADDLPIDAPRPAKPLETPADTGPVGARPAETTILGEPAGTSAKGKAWPRIPVDDEILSRNMVDVKDGATRPIGDILSAMPQIRRFAAIHKLREKLGIPDERIIASKHPDRVNALEAILSIGEQDLFRVTFVNEAGQTVVRTAKAAPMASRGEWLRANRRVVESKGLPDVVELARDWHVSDDVIQKASRLPKKHAKRELVDVMLGESRLFPDASVRQPLAAKGAKGYGGQPVPQGLPSEGGKGYSMQQAGQLQYWDVGKRSPGSFRIDRLKKFEIMQGGEFVDAMAALPARPASKRGLLNFPDDLALPKTGIPGVKPKVKPKKAASKPEMASVGATKAAKEIPSAPAPAPATKAATATAARAPSAAGKAARAGTVGNFAEGVTKHQGKSRKIYTTEVVPSAAKADVKAFQFRGKVDEFGVTTKRALKGEWDAGDQGVSTFWRDKSGQLWVADGHHRLAFAKSKGAKSIRAQIIDEADGWTKQDAIVFGARQNIKGDSGSVADFARFFRNAGMDERALKAEGWLAKDRAKDAHMLATRAKEDLWVAYLNEAITERKVLAIARGTDSAGAQGALIRRLKTHPNESAEHLGAVASGMSARASAAKQAGGEVQGDLFDTAGRAEIDAFVAEESLVAKEVARRMKSISGELAALKWVGDPKLKPSTLKRRLASAKKKGRIEVADIATARRAVKDLTEQKEALGRYAQNPMLFDEIREAAGLAASPGRQALRATRKLNAAKGSPPKETPRPIRRGGEPPAEGTSPARTPSDATGLPGKHEPLPQTGGKPKSEPEIPKGSSTRKPASNPQVEKGLKKAKSSKGKKPAKSKKTGERLPFDEDDFVPETSAQKVLEAVGKKIGLPRQWLDHIAGKMLGSRYAAGKVMKWVGVTHFLGLANLGSVGSFMTARLGSSFGERFFRGWARRLAGYNAKSATKAGREGVDKMMKEIAESPTAPKEVSKVAAAVMATNNPVVRQTLLLGLLHTTKFQSWLGTEETRKAMNLLKRKRAS